MNNTTYIYHIRVGDTYYIGQSKRQGDAAARAYAAVQNEQLTSLSGNSQNRIYEHILSTYCCAHTDTSHEYFKKHCLDEWEVQFYSAESGYGFGAAQFREIYKIFGQSYIQSTHPAAVIATGEDLSDNALLDFAEIMHIMIATRDGYKLTNSDMGGQSGRICMREKGDNPMGATLFTRKTSPEVALALARTYQQQKTDISDAVSQLYAKIFAPSWEEDSAKYLQTYGKLDVPIPEHIAKEGTGWRDSWHTFVNSSLFTDAITQRIIEAFKSLGQNFWSDRSAVFKTTGIQDAVEKWLTNKVPAMELILKEELELRNCKITYNIQKQLNIQGAVDYILDALCNNIRAWLGEIIDRKKGAQARKAKSTLHIERFVPVSPTAIFKFKYMKQNKANFIDTAPAFASLIPSGSASRAYFQQMSLYLFNWMMKHSDKTQYTINKVFRIPQAKQEVQTFGGLPMWRHFYLNNQNSKWDQWGEPLYKRMRDTYAVYAPGYVQRGWFEFYRPMVAAWRRQQGRSLTQYTSPQGSTYWATTAENGTLLLYKSSHIIDTAMITLY